MRQLGLRRERWLLLHAHIGLELVFGWLMHLAQGGRQNPMPRLLRKLVVSLHSCFLQLANAPRDQRLVKELKLLKHGLLFALALDDHQGRVWFVSLAFRLP